MLFQDSGLTLASFCVVDAPIANTLAAVEYVRTLPFVDTLRSASSAARFNDADPCASWHRRRVPAGAGMLHSEALSRLTVGDRRSDRSS